jgi:Carboxypeptidase regulatory-like domain
MAMSKRIANNSVARAVFCLWVIFVCASAAASAQAGLGGISGLISDPSGAIVPGAKVVAQNRASGIKNTTVSTAAGVYSFVALVPGTYDLSATQKGFETSLQKNILVTIDQVATSNITLRIGNVSEVVTVTESSSLVDSTNTTVGQLIEATTIDRVPLLTRNVFDLVQLSAGVTPANGSPNSSSSVPIINISTGRPNVDVSSYTINGAIIGNVYYMLDGSPIGVAEQNAGAIIPAMEIPEDAVEETRVETQNTPASYQSGGAGVISLASKSGGEKFHGDGFVVLRPNVLAANDYFNKQFQLNQGQANTTPDFHRYQEGGAIGGPIPFTHKKLFFFADYEATQQQQFDGSNTFTVPTAAELQGDFTADTAGFKIFDPIATNPDGSRNQFVGANSSPGCSTPTANCIPSSYLNPIAQTFLSHFPAPTTTAYDPDHNPQHVNNLFVPGLDPTTAQRFDIRIDWAKSEKQRIFGRFSFDRLFTSGVNAFHNAWDLNYAQNVTNGRNFILADDLTLSPTTVLQLRYSFTRHYENQGGDPAQAGEDDLASLGFVTPTAADEIYKTLPYVNFNDVGGGIGGTANYNTFIYASENNDASVTLTKDFGKHAISTGFEFMKRFLNVGQPPAPSGAYQFDQTATNGDPSDGGNGNDFASFLVGLGTSPGTENTNFTKDLFVAEASPYYAAFVEDTYKVSKSLTITAGLRWDIFGGKTERHNRLEYFDPKASASASGVSFTGAEVYVGNGNSRSPFTTNFKDFGPRLGFSWQTSAHFVFHGGAGFYFGPSSKMVGTAGLDSDGYSTTTNWNATCYNDLGNSTFFGTSACTGATPGSPVPSSTGIYSFSNPFPVGEVPLISNPTGLANNLGTALSTMLHSQRTQLTYNFNFGWEYEFPYQIVFSASYVGSRGLFLPLAQPDLNQLDLGTIASQQAALCADPGDYIGCVMVPNQWASILPPTNANYGMAMVPLWVSLQPFPQFGSGGYGSGNGIIVHGHPGGDSEYSSLQTKVQKRLTSHFTTLASFTWAKLITDDGNPPLGFVGSHAGQPQDWKNLNYEHSVSPQDVKYQFTGVASYDLPVGRGRAVNLHGFGDAVLGGWTANGIFYLSTGVPIQSPLAAASGSFAYFTQRVNLSCDPAHGAPHTAAEWFKPDCFTAPNPYLAGSAPAYLDHVRTMGANDVDLSFYKNFKFGEVRNLRFEVSSYNIANRVQLGAPNVSSLGDLFPAFGNITSDVNNPRQFQFASRFTF